MSIFLPPTAPPGIQRLERSKIQERNKIRAWRADARGRLQIVRDVAGILGRSCAEIDLAF